LIDDMGFNDFYQSQDLAAAWPTVATLAKKDCVLLSQYYTQQLCTPSRAAFMTGRMPLRLGLQHQVINGAQDYGLPLDEVTLPDKLKSVGYRTYGVGKWHLGMYNNASTPTHRGFDHYYGYFNGYEDYWSHTVALGANPSTEPVENGYLDLHDDNTLVWGKEGQYGPELFKDKVYSLIQEHRAHHKESPMFLYYPMQNVHDPLEAMDEDRNSTACSSVPNSERRTFCGMARSADRAIANLTAALKEAFGDEDVVVMFSGDNGGNPMSAGNNCPNETSFCLRGKKATLWEGGIRNHALVCSETLLPAPRKGASYDGGLVHLMDLHATLEELARVPAAASKARPLDGSSVWSAITTGGASPRKEFVVNIDPCSGHGSCNGVEEAIRSGDWKYMSGVSSETWYPVPSETSLSTAWQGGQQGDSKTWLFNVTHDPGETINLADTYPEVVAALQAKLDGVATEALAPCNVPNGTCNAENMDGWALIKKTGAWVPWVKDAAKAVKKNSEATKAAGSEWSCTDCSCQSDNPVLWECCNGLDFSDCYDHLKWGDKAECKAFCK